MNKKILFIFLIILVLLGYIFNIDRSISNKITNTTLYIKSTYNIFLENTITTFYSFYNQKETIDNLQNRISNNRHFETLYNISNGELSDLKKEFQDKNISIDVTYTKVLSYLKLNDFSKVILDIELPIQDKIFGLSTANSFSAGIVLKQNEQTIAYLNSNPKCNYAVFIGISKAPGITSGADKAGNIIIKHIPKWYGINIDDKVITSGMDNIFSLGIKVGEVIDIKELSNTKTAIVKPYAKVLSKKHFYLINIH